MFRRKRLIRVEVTLEHGAEKPDIKEVIEVAPGQSFHKGIEADYLREGGTIAKAFNWKAGYTVIYDFFYK